MLGRIPSRPEIEGMVEIETAEPCELASGQHLCSCGQPARQVFEPEVALVDLANLSHPDDLGSLTREPRRRERLLQLGHETVSKLSVDAGGD